MKLLLMIIMIMMIMMIRILTNAVAVLMMMVPEIMRSRK